MTPFLVLALSLLAPGQDDPGLDPELVALHEESVARQRDAMWTRIAEDRVRSTNLLREESSVLGAIHDLDRALDRHHLKSKALRRDRERLDRRAAQVRGALASAEARLAEVRGALARRADAVMRLRRTSIAALVDRGRRPAETRRLKDWLKLVLDHDARLFAEAGRSAQAVRNASATLADETRALEETEAALAEAQAAVARLRAERVGLLDQVRAERKGIERLAKKIAEQAKSLELHRGLVHGLLEVAPRPGGFAEQRGRLPWPVVGTVEALFGKRVDPDTRLVFDASGIELLAPFGDPVRAVAPGRVVYAERLAGFGNLVVVDHGGGHHTLYGHLDEIAVATGDPVERLLTLGTLGESGSRRGPLLYFGVRVQHVAVDPLGWLGP